MLFDALKAETWRILRNRLVIFFSVVLVPLLLAVGGVVFHLITDIRSGELASQVGLTGLPVEPVNLGESLAFAAQKAANGAGLVFMLIAGATVYAGDYRWETWRLISARNDRTTLILGKVGTMKVLALATIALFLAASVVFFVSQAVVFGRPVAFEMTGGQAGDAVLTALLSYVRIVQYGLIGLLTAVVSRSLLAALFVPIALGFGQSILGAPPVMGLLNLQPGGWPAQLLMPGLAYDTLKEKITPGSANGVGVADALWPALTSLALWTAVPLILAVIWFRRQDLSKE